MFFTHLLKSAEYFIIEGIPTIPFEHWAEIPGALAFNLLKLIEIYLSMF
ncbi:MAG: hypothetical protein IJA31_11615 [Clostridia bacterium]|nr:hypothetical protein [Clostridia bacterium]MBQ3519955.1 hypothetical protein [Clostridia bacterium]